MVKQADAASSTQEPCVSCGEETAAGSVFFSDRLEIPRDGQPDGFLCSACNARIRAAHKPQQWTDADVATFVRNASAADITWSSRF